MVRPARPVPSALHDLEARPAVLWGPWKNRGSLESVEGDIPRGVQDSIDLLQDGALQL